MPLDTTSYIEDAIRASVEKQFEGIPARLRLKHIAELEDYHKITAWRKYTSGKIPKPCRDDNGHPWWVNQEYKEFYLNRLLAEARHAQD